MIIAILGASSGIFLTVVGLRSYLAWLPSGVRHSMRILPPTCAKERKTSPRRCLLRISVLEIQDGMSW